MANWLTAGGGGSTIGEGVGEMSDSPERDDSDLADEPNREGFAGGATTPEVVHDRGLEAEAERIAVPSDDLTSAISDAFMEGRHHDEESTEDK
ncbi:hypothetical protein GCM10023170_024380 [Phytohabitans houttuyneae]